MALNFGNCGGAPNQFKGEEIKGTRIYVPIRLRKDAEMLVEGIRNGTNSLGLELGSFGALFHGLPGTGKSHFARYLAEQSGAIFFDSPMLTSAEDVVGLFEAARKSRKETEKPVIVLMDDLEYVGKRSEGGNSGFRPVLAQLLQECDMSPNNENIFRVITTNLEDNLDEALRRPPRITFEIEFLPPLRVERLEILKSIIGSEGMKLKWSDEILSYAADITFGYTPGDLVGVVQHASISALVNKREDISKEDVSNAKNGVLPSAIRDMPFYEPKEKLDDLSGGYVFYQKQLLSEMAVRIEKGLRVILYGPSGCGKTMLAKSLAGSFGYNCMVLNPADVVDKYIGETGKIISKAINRAKALSPSILVIDQAEGIINPENPYAKEWLSVLKAKLSEPIEGVMVILTTTDPRGFGEEILSRFRKVYVSHPDQISLTAMMDSMRKEGETFDSAEVISKSGTLTPRDVKEAIFAIRDLGGTVDTKTIIAVLKSNPQTKEGINYDQVAAILGDDTRLYMAIKQG